MINEEEKKQLEELYQSYLHNEKILKMKDYQMHRGSNCYVHSFKVCKLCIHKVYKKKNYSFEDLKNIIIASILHDYYLYDWRVDHSKKKKHGKIHPLVACSNAIRDFNISKEVQDIIKSHMWPLTPKLYPKTKEAKLVNRVDDYVATFEGLSFRRYKKHKEEKYLKKISHLFDD